MTHEPEEKEARLRELGEFLRNRRGRISPGSLGLSVSKARRSTGLRRVEVATLAGVSLSWYTWLEQGRNIAVSASVLARVTKALQLNDEESTHVFELAGQGLPISAKPEAVNESTRALLDNLELTPAYVTGARWDILAWNEASSVVYDFGALDPADRNMVTFLFCVSRARALYADWESVARRAVALFRMSAGPFLGEPRFRSLIDELKTRSPEFEQFWTHKHVLRPNTSRRELHHDSMGSLQFDRHVLDMMESPNLRLVVDSPVPGTGTYEKMRNVVRARQ
ncbi:helix-turn-helix transcriptional regulator [Pendulispora rubella]|uniref:Helix-turn-helix transcriptional regulator n=1 Tax=Pendulispora rubella TaxID=2741070 RepID=A0ABZ2KZ73_9BACT